MNLRDLAPIVLFVYNRPEHTLQTLKALASNNLANESILYIYADGPKEDTDTDILQDIDKTRKIIRQQQWCKEVHIIESETNKGLANSITEGVTEVINKHGSIIVLEDDIVTSPYFLQYMNDALSFYVEKDKVMHISAFTPYTTGAEKLPETYFLRFMSCWGWGTWKRAWDKLILDTEYLYKELPSRPDFNHFDLDNSTNAFDQVEKNYTGHLKTWAVKWYASIFINNGLCLYPRNTLVKNIGFDGTGENCGNNKVLAWTHHILDLNKPVKILPIEIEESKVGYNYLKRYYKYGKDSSVKIKVLHFIDKNVILRQIYKLYYKIKKPI